MRKYLNEIHCSFLVIGLVTFMYVFLVISLRSVDPYIYKFFRSHQTYRKTLSFGGFHHF